MTTYWVSRGKHYCKLCKIWIQPDKQSIFNHENGRKHKEIAEEHIKETRKQSRMEMREKEELDRQLAAIDAAAREQQRAQGETVRDPRPGRGDGATPGGTDASARGGSAAGERGLGSSPLAPRGAPPPQSVPTRTPWSEGAPPLPGGLGISSPTRGEGRPPGPLQAQPPAQTPAWGAGTSAGHGSTAVYPPGWSEQRTADGVAYYFCAHTAMSQWHPPPGWPSAAPTTASAQPPPPGPAAEHSWQLLRTPEGHPYWYNAATGASQWAPPLQLAHAPAASACDVDAGVDEGVEGAGVEGCGAPAGDAGADTEVGPAEAATPNSETAVVPPDEAPVLGAWTTVSVRRLEAGGSDMEDEVSAEPDTEAGRRREGAQLPHDAADAAWKVIADRIEDEGGGGDDAKVDEQGLLHGDNLVQHLHVRFPKRKTLPQQATTLTRPEALRLEPTRSQ